MSVFSRWRHLLAVLVASLLLVQYGAAQQVNKTSSSSNTTTTPQTQQCKPIPGDAAWPPKSAWDSLNTTVEGRLIATVPLPSVCHDPTYDETACEALQAVWGMPNQQIPYPAEFLQPWFLNQSCSPFTDKALPCELGNYASYSINIVDAASDIAAGIAFAKDHNVRLVVKNTGSDFMGKSTGTGALSLWTHNLDSMDFVTYESSYYNGTALKVGAGVQSGPVAKYAYDNGYRVVLGSCETVGFAGGFIQGGGHSQLSGLYGMAADQILEIELVTPAGEFLTATPAKNTDLYWALAGGGGGTYAVVTSMTVRVFPEAPVVYASFYFTVATLAGDVDGFWAAVQTFHTQLDLLTATGSEGMYFHTDYSISNDTLYVVGLLAPNGTTEAELTSLLSPMLEALAALNNALTPDNMGYTTTSTSSWYEEFQNTLAPALVNASMVPVVGARFLPRTATSSGYLDDNATSQAVAVTAALRTMTAGGNFTIGCAAANANNNAASGKAVQPVAPNAVFSSWRTALASCFGYSAWDWQTMDATDWDTVLALQTRVEDVIQPALAAAMPTTGAYLNEANWDTPDWQITFYGPGAHYESLLEIKNAYDPQGVFYGLTAVGSEAWETDEDGRLCRVNTSSECK